VNTISISVTRSEGGLQTWLHRVGNGMARHRRAILAIQWSVVVFYAVLVTLPAFLPLPGPEARLFSSDLGAASFVDPTACVSPGGNPAWEKPPCTAPWYERLVLLAQFLFWGLWWPFVMLSMMLFGRVWCGVFCPEGTLTEFASQHGLGRAIPRWIRWQGWPLLAFAGTTIYGQLVSVYEYPKAALLVLGGSTVAAVAIGLVYGREKRVWCRYLCPANGVFRLLARLAPVHFRTDEQAWKRAPQRTPAVNCAPLVDMRHLRSNAACHACGRCAGHRDAISLAPRSPNAEILSLGPRDASRREALLLVFGIFGIALGAFQWSSSPWFVALKQAAATWLVEHDAMMLLQENAPWWILTHYPEVNDVFTWLDGLCILAYIGTYALGIGELVLGALRTAQAVVRERDVMWQLAFSLIPLAGASVFLGLSMLTLSHLSAERIDLAWVPWARAILLGGATAWSIWLAWRMLVTRPVSLVRRAAALAVVLLAVSPVVALWVIQFYVW
jgi:polyferredoxin